MRLLVLSACLLEALGTTQYVQGVFLPLELVGVHIPTVLYWLPWIAGVVFFFILTTGVKDETQGFSLKSIRRNRLIERLILVGILMSIVGMVPSSFREKRLGWVSVPNGTNEKIDWSQFQVSLDFKVTWCSQSYKGEGIIFEKAPGRTERVEALLIKFHCRPTGLAVLR